MGAASPYDRRADYNSHRIRQTLPVTPLSVAFLCGTKVSLPHFARGVGWLAFKKEVTHGEAKGSLGLDFEDMLASGE